jgi:hypothetical protein
MVLLPIWRQRRPAIYGARGVLQESQKWPEIAGSKCRGFAKPSERFQRLSPKSDRLPLAIFGPENYAYRLGLIGAPSRICQALAPLGFGLLIGPMGRLVVAVSAGLSLAALVALMALRRTEATQAIVRAAE